MTDITNGPLTTEGIEDNTLPSVPENEAPPVTPDSRLIRTLKTLGWTSFGVFFLLLFTLLKLPDERIKTYVQGMVASLLAPKGVGFTAEKGYISLGWGVSYVMKDVTLSFPPPQPPARIEKITITPSLLPLLLGYQGARLTMVSGDGRISGSFSLKGSQLSVSFDSKQLDLGKTGILGLTAGIKGTTLVSGSGSVSGDTTIPSTLTGDLNLSITRTQIDQQSIMGFNVPKLSISEGKIELSADKGKAVIKTLKLGRPGSADDLQATASGDVILGRNWDSSTLNAKVNFKLSDTVMKAFILIDALLGPGKQGDGSYSLTLSGPVTAPNSVPLPPGSK